MNMPEATQEQITAFEKGAAARYAEFGVPTELAQALYAQQMNKEAADLGMTPEAPKPERVEKIASELASVMGKERTAAPKPERVEKIASELASVLGKERSAKK